MSCRRRNATNHSNVRIHHSLITTAKLATALLFVLLSPLYCISIYLGVLIVSWCIDRRLDNRGRFCLFALLLTIVLPLTNWIFGAFNDRRMLAAFGGWLLWILHRPEKIPGSDLNDWEE